MRFERISILGVGLMGGSVGMACRKAAIGARIVGYTHRPDELKHAVERGAIDQAATDAMSAVRDADLVILAVPVGLFRQMMTTIAPVLKAGSIVTDIGSTKRAVTALAEEILPQQAHFVGSHPMAGGEKHGIDHARPDLLAGALCILTPTDSTDASALETVEQFWHALQMRTVCMTPQLHDQLTADISHLPHTLAAALMRIQSPQSLQLAARGFLDSTRIAAGDSGLWRDILLENRDNLRLGIARLQADLGQLLHHLDSGDIAAVQHWLTAAADARSGMRKNAE